MDIRRFTGKYLKPFSGQAVVYLLLTLLSVVFMLTTVLSIPDFLQILFPSEVNEAMNNNSTASANYLAQASNQIYGWLMSLGKEKAILFFSLLIFIMYAFKNVFGYLSLRVMVSIRSKVVRDIHNDMYSKLLKLPLSFYSSNKTGDIISRFSNDVLEYDETILKSIHQISVASIMILLYLSALIYINLSLTLFVLIFLPVGGFLISRITRSLKRKSLQMQQKSSFIMSLAEETISGLRVIKAYTAINFFNNRFQHYNESYTRLRNTVYRRVDLASPISDFLGNCIVMVILIFGSRLVLAEDATLSPQMFIGYLFLFVIIINPIKDISTSIYNLRKGTAVIERITDIFAEKEYICDKSGTTDINSFNHNIQFKNVSFSYNEEDMVLNSINLTIPKGKLIAIVGASGAGKSTLVDLIPRFYDCTSGEILIDGKNVKDVSLKSIRHLLGFVTQDTILFNDTILNNIALGVPEATEEEIITAAKIANAHEFIEKMEHGYYTNIGDRGGRLSGGQRQRISIARAILKNPPILILDEATSALDTESERLVQDALAEIMKNRTAIMIAHRLSTIQNADEIIVMNKGEIVQQGTHAELLNKEGIYQKLCNMQTFA